MKQGQRTSIKVCSAALAFVPLALLSADFPPKDSVLENALLFFNFPALGVCYSADKIFHLKFFDQRAFLIISMLIWASFIGWVFWKIAATFLGEEELEFETHPEKAKFDWERFRIRFFFGFIIGFLCGWRFVKKTHSMQTVVVASIVAGIIGGFVFGISRPPNFWSRP